MISSFELDVYLGSGGLLALPPVKPRSALCLNVPGLFLEHPNSARLLWPVRRPNVRPAVPFPPSRRHGAGRSIFLAALLGERAETANVLRRINPCGSSRPLDHGVIAGSTEITYSPTPVTFGQLVRPYPL
jgi:hypothetical protein